MKISVITAVYNNAATIAQALDSILSQSHADKQIIVIDGASTDGTTEILRSYGSKIDVLESEPDAGIYDAMNKGIGWAIGDIVAILNSDDFYAHPNVLSDVARAFTSEPDADCLYGDLEYVQADNTTKVTRRWISGSYNPSRFLYGWMPPHPTFFVRREIYSKFGIFKTEFDTAADYEIMLRFLYKNKLKSIYIPDTLVYMRTGGASNSRLSNRLKANHQDSLAWKANDIDPLFFTLWLKPVRKIPQFIKPKIQRLFNKFFGEK